MTTGFLHYMNTIKSVLNDTTITPSYDEETNTVDIAIGTKDGFRFIHLSYEQCDELIQSLTELKNEIV